MSYFPEDIKEVEEERKRINEERKRIDEERKRIDEERKRICENEGWRVENFTAEEVFDNPDFVAWRIKEQLVNSPNNRKNIEQKRKTQVDIEEFWKDASIELGISVPLLKSYNKKGILVKKVSHLRGWASALEPLIKRGIINF